MSGTLSSTKITSGRGSDSFEDFFELPGEVRNKIYEFVAYSWTSRPFPSSHNTLLPQVGQETSAWDSVNLLLVSRRLRGETTRIIMEKKAFNLRRLFARGYDEIEEFARASNLKPKWIQHLELDYWNADHVLFTISKEHIRAIAFGPPGPTCTLCDCSDSHTDAALELRQTMQSIRTVSVTNTKEYILSARMITLDILDSLSCPCSRRTLDLLWPRLDDIRIVHEHGSMRLRKDWWGLWRLAYSNEPLPAMSSMGWQSWIESVVNWDTGLLEVGNQRFFFQPTWSAKEDDCVCRRRSRTSCYKLDENAE